MRCLRPGGRLELELNTHDERYGGLRYYDRATLRLFRSRGRVAGNRVRVLLGRRSLTLVPALAWERGDRVGV
jgi:hypothetical protein